MLEGAFSFRGRLGRLQFFLDSLALGVACFLFVVAVAFFVMPAKSTGLAMAVVIGAVVLFAPVVIWVSLSLQARRIRDIGWDPVVVLVGWAALGVLDLVLAKLVPSLAVPDQHGTFIGSFVNLAMSLALLFWPSSDDAGDVSAPPPRMTRLESLGLANGPAVVLPGAAPPPSRPRAQGFGRRNLP
jgi:uncharacterized membrane protein YhaH (DUF805 family)